MGSGGGSAVPASYANSLAAQQTAQNMAAAQGYGGAQNMVPVGQQVQGNNFWQNAGQTLGRGALGFAEGMTGQPYLTSYERNKLQKDISEKELATSAWKEGGSPSSKAEIEYKKAATYKALQGDIGDRIKTDAYKAYLEGNRDPETLKSIGKWVDPMEAMYAGMMGFGAGMTPNVTSENKPVSSKKQKNIDVNETYDTLPEYDTKKYKSQKSTKTGKFRLVPLK